jgi:hypothetical protein
MAAGWRCIWEYNCIVEGKRMQAKGIVQLGQAAFNCSGSWALRPTRGRRPGCHRWAHQGAAPQPRTACGRQQGHCIHMHVMMSLACNAGEHVSG